MTNPTRNYDKVVYLLQGGGALGAYQVGACQALLEFGIEPDWMVGTSIGAINSAIIAGNKPQHRIKNLRGFWEKIAVPFPFFHLMRSSHELRKIFNFWSAQLIACFGIPGFFKPRFIYPWLVTKTTPDNVSFYDTSELRETLLEFIDFDLINERKIRLTLGAVNVRTSKAVNFDNYHQIITPEHIMASGALPPGFPAIKIGDEYYWDGGLSSNTPFNVVMQERIPERLLCLMINLYSYWDHVPTNIMGVLKAKKEIEYLSKHNEALKFYCELHFLQNVIQSVANKISDNDRINQAMEMIKHIGHPIALEIVRFHYIDQSSDLWTKDFNFSQQVLYEHCESGYKDVQNALKDPDWLNCKVSERGVALHEF